MATIRTQGGSVLLKSGAVSCECCDDLPTQPSQSCLKASQFVSDFSNYPPQEGPNTLVSGYYTIHLTNAEFLFYTTTPAAQMRETYTASSTMRQTWPTNGPGSFLVDFALSVDHERLYTKGQNDNVNNSLELNITSFTDCGLLSNKRISYEENSNVTAQATIAGTYTNCSIPLNSEPISTAEGLIGGNLFFSRIVFIEDDRDVDPAATTHLMLYGAEFQPLNASVILRNPLSNNPATNKMFHFDNVIRYNLSLSGSVSNSLNQFPGQLTTANSSVTILGKNIPVFARLQISEGSMVGHPCRLASTFSPALSNLNFNMTYALEFLASPP